MFRVAFLSLVVLTVSLKVSSAQAPPRPAEKPQSDTPQSTTESADVAGGIAKVLQPDTTSGDHCEEQAPSADLLHAASILALAFAAASEDKARDESYIDLFCEIGVAQVEAGLMDQARKSFAAAQAIVDLQQVPFGMPYESEWTTWLENIDGEVALHQSEEGQFDRALESAARITDADSHVRVLGQIAVDQATAGVFDEAFATVERISEKTSQQPSISTRLQGTARSYQADNLKDSQLSVRARTLNTIAICQVKAGLAEPARATFGQALAGTDSIKDGVRRVRVLAQICSAQIEAELYDAAFATIDKIAEVIAHPVSISPSLHEKVRQNLMTAGRNDQLAIQVRALCEIAGKQMEGRLEKEARSSFDAALACCARIVPARYNPLWDDDRFHSLRDVAVAQAKVGFLDEALAISETVTKPEIRATILREIAVVEMEAGRSDLARSRFAEALACCDNIVPSTQNPNAVDQAICSVAIAQARAGLCEEALLATEKITTESLKRLALDQIIPAQLKAGLYTEALVASEKLVDPSVQAAKLYQIAVAQGRAGLFEEAVLTSRKVANETSRASILAQIAVAQAKAGLFDEAFVDVEEIPIASSRGSALAQIAGEQAEAGLLDRALKTMEKVTDSSPRAGAFRRIAACRVESGQGNNVLKWVKNEPDSFVRAFAYLGILDGLRAKQGSIVSGHQQGRRRVLFESNW